MNNNVKFYLVINRNHEESIMTGKEIVDEAIKLSELMYKESDSYIDLDIYNELKATGSVSMAIAVLRMNSWSAKSA